MMKKFGPFVFILLLFPCYAIAGENYFSVKGDQVLFNDEEFKVIGLRCSNALISDEEVDELIENLDVFRSYGVNTISVFIMGSRFGDINGYLPDSSLNPVYAMRLARIIEESDRRGLIVLVGCLYWSNSKAKEDLNHWQQTDANKAVANTVRWLKGHDYRNVFVDPDNEGMASIEKGWSIEEMIESAHEADPTYVVGFNLKSSPPENADLLLHHSPKDGRRPYIESEGTPANAPGGYWGSFSKTDNYYNYIRIGLYTPEMRQNQIQITQEHLSNHAGYMFASTWLQCAPYEGIGGPFMHPGGNADNPHIDQDVKNLQPEAGILWWLEWVKNQYGPWKPASKIK